MQATVVSAEDLIAATREPERWGNLIVRVGGFSARFTALGEGLQQSIIARTSVSNGLRNVREIQMEPYHPLGKAKSERLARHSALPDLSFPDDAVVLVIAGYFSPKNNVVADDIILALDAATGKTKWKQVFPGKGYNLTASNPRTRVLAIIFPTATA